MADARALDSETAADLADELQHMKGELTRTRRELHHTSAELHDVRDALAAGCPEDNGAEADGYPAGAGADATADDEDADDEEEDGASAAVHSRVVVWQQEEISRLRDLLDEEADRRRALEQQVGPVTGHPTFLLV